METTMKAHACRPPAGSWPTLVLSVACPILVGTVSDDLPLDGSCFLVCWPCCISSFLWTTVYFKAIVQCLLVQNDPRLRMTRLTWNLDTCSFKNIIQVMWHQPFGGALAFRLYAQGLRPGSQGLLQPDPWRRNSFCPPGSAWLLWSPHTAPSPWLHADPSPAKPLFQVQTRASLMTSQTSNLGGIF